MTKLLLLLLILASLLAAGCKSGQAEQGPNPQESLPGVNAGNDPRNPPANPPANR